MADPITMIAVAGTLASLGSSIYIRMRGRQKKGEELVNLVIKRPDGTEVRLDNVPRSAVERLEREVEPHGAQ